MLRHLISVLIAVILPTMSFGQFSDDDYLVDSVFDLRNVQDLEIDTGEERMLVTLSEAVLYFDLFPLSLIKAIPLDIRAASGSLSARGNLFVVGEDEDENNPSVGPSGTVKVYKDFKNSPEDDVGFQFPLDTTPISDSFFNGTGEFFAVGPTRFSVLNISERFALDRIEAGKALLMNPLMLQCGTSAHYSVFSNKGRLFYVSSVNGQKVIEYGPVDPDGLRSDEADCFNPNRLLVGKNALARSFEDFSPVRHALVNASAFMDDTEDYANKGILTFDVDERSLAFFPFEYFDEQISIVRSESIRFKLDDQLGPPDKSSDFGLLATDLSANVILLSYFGSNVVHRLSWADGNFRYQGRFETDRPIKSLYITPLGDYAAIVSGALARGGNEEVILIKWPDRIPPFSDLASSRFSVTALQQELAQSVDEDLEADGIFGSKTQQAMKFYLEGGNVDNDAASGQTRSVNVVPATPSTVREPQNALRQTIRGLFPLQ
jgi:hypothetical protein